MNCVFLYSPDTEKFNYPESSPFDTSRAGRTFRMIKSLGLLEAEHVRWQVPRPAREDALLGFHSRDYLARLRSAAEGEIDLSLLTMGLGGEDTPLFSGMWDFACLAAGGTLAGAELLLRGEAQVVFHPNGGFHHAMPAQASGFCYLNDVALACLSLTAAGKRVLYLDLDVHHGDGVQSAFYNRSDCMTVSLHESGDSLFPGTGYVHENGEMEGAGYSLNVPLPIGTDDSAYLRAFYEGVVPVLRKFDPDVFVLQLGMDALSGDPLAHLGLTNNALAEIVNWVVQRERPVLATGGGGYQVENTARGWALMWNLLSGQPEPGEDLTVGLGGVMLQSSDWAGGIRDRTVVIRGQERDRLDKALTATLNEIKNRLFPLHGL